MPKKLLAAIAAVCLLGACQEQPPPAPPVKTFLVFFDFDKSTLTPRAMDIVKEAANVFLNAKGELRDAGELSPRTWVEYKAMADELVAHLGRARLVSDLDPDDFASLRSKLAKKNSR